MGEIKIYRTAKGEAWAYLNAGAFRLSCFSSVGREPSTIGQLCLDRGANSAEVHLEDSRVAVMLPKVAALFGVELDEQTVADAIAACRLALAERALAELKVREEMQRAEVVS